MLADGRGGRPNTAKEPLARVSSNNISMFQPQLKALYIVLVHENLFVRYFLLVIPYVRYSFLDPHVNFIRIQQKYINADLYPDLTKECRSWSRSKESSCMRIWIRTGIGSNKNSQMRIWIRIQLSSKPSGTKIFFFFDRAILQIWPYFRPSRSTVDWNSTSNHHECLLQGRVVPFPTCLKLLDIEASLDWRDTTTLVEWDCWCLPWESRCPFAT